LPYSSGIFNFLYFYKPLRNTDSYAAFTLTVLTTRNETWRL